MKNQILKTVTLIAFLFTSLTVSAKGFVISCQESPDAERISYFPLHSITIEDGMISFIDRDTGEMTSIDTDADCVIENNILHDNKARLGGTSVEVDEVL